MNERSLNESPMNEYSHILVALNLGEESEQVLSRAAAIAQSNHARLSLVHVIEPLGYAYGGDIPMDLTEIQQQLDAHAHKQLDEMARRVGVAPNDTHVLVGRTQNEIHRFAEEQGVDLVVVGSHGRHGLQLLLGSTASATLHGACCDVLAVRIHPTRQEQA